MKEILKNWKQKLREKLELDNPEKYVNGFYQLSKKQKLLWVSGLFVISFIFLFFTGPDSVSYLLDVALSCLFALILLTVSFLYSCLCYYPSLLFFNPRSERKKISVTTSITLYQICTIFLIIGMSLITFRFSYDYKHITILILTVLFVNFINHKKTVTHAKF